MDVPEWCAICKHPVDSSASTLGEKGSLAINQASKSRKDSVHSVPSQTAAVNTVSLIRYPRTPSKE